MQKPLAEVFTWPSEDPQLVGARCDDCAAVCFPLQSRCPRCGRPDMIETLLPREGTLVSFTTQGFPPIVPYAGDQTGEKFQSFAVGLVELDDVVRVEARLTESDPARLSFDMPVKLAIVPFFQDGDDQIMTFAFSPVRDDAMGS